VAQVVYSARAIAHLQRLFEFLAENDPMAASAGAAAIRSAIGTLGDHQWIGRPLSNDLRELVISFGSSGYIALYRVLPSRGEVRILAIKHQRELRYRQR
jgi:plasmid stabilization system protein ParE